MSAKYQEVQMEGLSFDEFVSEIQQVFTDLPDSRHYSPNQHYSMKDAALGAFAMFFTQSPSFLAYQQAMEQAQGRNNARSIFGIEEIPSDNQIRNLLDPVAPQLLYPVFDKTIAHLQEAKCLDKYRFFQDHLLVPIDGTQYFHSAKIHCPNCTETRHSNGKVSYSHKVVTPVVAAPSNPEVVPLAPELVVPQDGSDKQDCELNAAKRWIERHGELAAQKVIILGDDLFSREPFCRLLLEHGFHFILVCKPESHQRLYEWVESLDAIKSISTLSFRRWNGRFHENYHFRYANRLPIKDEDNALEVNWVEITVTRTDTKEILYRNAFVTDWTLEPGNVPLIVESGRARWKVENENNNVLKTKGYHLEHNFGHGSQFLSSTLLTLNLLAFLAHTFLQFVDSSYQAVRKKLSARKAFFHDLTTLTKYLFFDGWNQLINFMLQQLQLKPSKPG